MTEQSSCKRSFFKEYLFYRIGTLKGNLLICSVLNLLGLPFFALGHLHMSSAQLNGTGVNRDFFGYASFCGPMCVYAVMIMAVTGAAASFAYFNKKELTDTLGVLPLTHGERFRGDFLGGYIANVAPFIPCALIAVIMFVVTQKNYDIIAARSVAEPSENCIAFIVGLSLTLFFIYTLGYIISALVTSIFGRFMFAEIFSVIGIIVSTALIMGVSGCFLNEVSGVSAVNGDKLYAMPLGPLFGEVGESFSRAGAFSDMYADRMEFFTDFMILKPLNIVIFTVAAAALTILAYYISKSRRQERVGKIVVHGAAFRGMALLTAAAAVMIAVSLYSEKDILPSFIIGSAIGAVIVIVFEVIRRPRVKEIPRTVFGYAGTIICCYGLCILFRGTGAFGLRYINAVPEEIKYIDVGVSFGSGGQIYGGNYKLTGKNDIRQFTEKHNSILKSYGNWVHSGDEFVVEYKFTDGTTLLRGYMRWKYNSETPIIDMINNLYSLEGYPKALCSFMTDGSAIENCTAVIEGAYGSIFVPTDKFPEFLEMFSSEIIENYSADAETCGGVSVVLEDAKNNNRSVDIPIQKNYTKTLGFLRALASSDSEDDNQLALTLSRGYSYNNGDDFDLKINIYKKDLDDELVKELFSLLKRHSDIETDDPDVIIGEISQKIDVSSMNHVLYCVPASTENRVTEIMIELAERAAQ